MLEKNELELLFDEFQNNPVLHIEQIQGCTTLEPYQTQICKDVIKYNRIAIAACHDIGKTFLMAKLVLFFGSVFPGAKIITTAPTHVQVENLLWSEIRSGFRDSKLPLGGEMLTTSWKIDDDWFALGMSPKEDAGSGGSQSRFQGFHGKKIIIIFDEATGVPRQRYQQIEGMLTSADTTFILIGNPTTKNCEFFKCFQSAEYHKIYLTCFDSPNLKINNICTKDDIMRETKKLKKMSAQEQKEYIDKYQITQRQLLTAQWVISKALHWGLEHPFFKSKVLGEFPDEEENALITMEDVETAQNREVPEDSSLRVIGVDPARFGSDSTVITIFEGARQTKRIELVKVDTMEVSGHIVNLIKTLPYKRIFRIPIDGTGIGSGVIDRLKELQRQREIPSHIEIIEVHFGAACTEEEDKEHFVNFKAKMFVQLAADIKSDLSLLPEAIYLEELPSILFKYDSKGRYTIESKDEYKKRTGAGSPDSSDSLALANIGRYNIKKVGEFPETQNLKGTSTLVGSIDSMSW